MERPARARAQGHRARVLCFAWARAAAGAVFTSRFAPRSSSALAARRGTDAQAARTGPAVPLRVRRGQNGAVGVSTVPSAPRPPRPSACAACCSSCALRRSLSEGCHVLYLYRLVLLCWYKICLKLRTVTRSSPDHELRRIRAEALPRCCPSRSQARRRTSVRARGWVAGRFACRLPPRCPRGRGTRAWHPAPRRACERVRAGARARRRRRRRGSPSRCMCVCARASASASARGGGCVEGRERMPARVRARGCAMTVRRRPRRPWRAAGTP
jgi:hypothetical protein